MAFVRMKPSVVRGVCVLLAVILMSHILKLTVTENYIHYLDSTEITNYTLIESLLTEQVNRNPVLSTPNSRSDIHLTLDELKQLADHHSNTDAIATIIIQYQSMASLQNQLSDLHLTRHTDIHIVCNTVEEKESIETFVIEHKEKYKISLKKQDKWYQHIQPDADYVILIENGAIPGKGYFDFIIGLLNTPQFDHALLGTESEANLCQQNEAHYIPSIMDVYVLRRAWYVNAMDLPSVLLPTSPTDTSLRGNTKSLSTCIHVYSGNIVFIQDDHHSLDDMICNFADQHDMLHVITTTKDSAAPTCPPSSSAMIIHHAVVKKELERMIKQLLPSIVIYPLDDTMEIPHYTNDVAFLGFPVKDIPLISPWIADLTLEALQQWHVPQINLVVATGGKRLSELKSLFKSIKAASYMGDQVNLSLVMDEKSNAISFAQTLPWQHGEKYLRHRISKAHPMQIFTEVWYPSNDNDYAIILDDRIELSNSFYIWLKYALLKYRYQEGSKQMSLFGISLYSPRILDTDPTGRTLLNAPMDSPYLMQVPTSLGGALYFPEYWREFHDYITARLTDAATVKRGSGNPHLFKDSLLTVSRTNKWLNSWRKYFDEMIYMRGYVMLYPPFQSGYSTLTTLSLNNKKKQALFNQGGAEKLFKVPMIKDLRELPDLEILSVLDLHGKLVDSIATLKERGLALQRKFSACKPNLKHANDPSDMLCPFAQWVTVSIEQQEALEPKTVHVYDG